MTRIVNKKSIIIIALCIILVSICSCSSAKMIKYYSQKDNYIEATGTIIHLKYNDDRSALYVEFSNLDPKFDDVAFKIVGENLKILKEKQIDDKIKIGDRVRFISAPQYFGDGYVFPIVALSANGESLLEFNEGWNNLIEWLEAQ